MTLLKNKYVECIFVLQNFKEEIHMKKKKILSELQDLKVQNQYLMRMLLQNESQKSEFASEDMKTESINNGRWNENHHFLDWLEEQGSQQTNQSEQTKMLIDDYEHQMKKIVHSNYRKQKKAARRIDKKYTNLLNGMEILQEEVKKESQKRKKAEREVANLEMLVKYLLYKEGVVKSVNQSVKKMIKCCEADRRELKNASSTPFLLEDHGGFYGG